MSRHLKGSLSKFSIFYFGLLYKRSENENIGFCFENIFQLWIWNIFWNEWQIVNAAYQTTVLHFSKETFTENVLY
jgi:hypothetical protein